MDIMNLVLLFILLAETATSKSIDNVSNVNKFNMITQKDAPNNLFGHFTTLNDRKPPLIIFDKINNDFNAYQDNSEKLEPYVNDDKTIKFAPTGAIARSRDVTFDDLLKYATALTEDNFEAKNNETNEGFINLKINNEEDSRKFTETSENNKNTMQTNEINKMKTGNNVMSNGLFKFTTAFTNRNNPLKMTDNINANLNTINHGNTRKIVETNAIEKKMNDFQQNGDVDQMTTANDMKTNNLIKHSTSFANKNNSPLLNHKNNEDANINRGNFWKLNSNVNDNLINGLAQQIINNNNAATYDLLRYTTATPQAVKQNINEFNENSQEINKISQTSDIDKITIKNYLAPVDLLKRTTLFTATNSIPTVNKNFNVNNPGNIRTFQESSANINNKLSEPSKNGLTTNDVLRHTTVFNNRNSQESVNQKIQEDSNIFKVNQENFRNTLNTNDDTNTQTTNFNEIKSKSEAISNDLLKYTAFTDINTPLTQNRNENNKLNRENQENFRKLINTGTEYVKTGQNKNDVNEKFKHDPDQLEFRNIYTELPKEKHTENINTYNQKIKPIYVYDIIFTPIDVQKVDPKYIKTFDNFESRRENYPEPEKQLVNKNNKEPFEIGEKKLDEENWHKSKQIDYITDQPNIREIREKLLVHLLEYFMAIIKYDTTNSNLTDKDKLGSIMNRLKNYYVHINTTIVEGEDNEDDEENTTEIKLNETVTEIDPTVTPVEEGKEKPIEKLNKMPNSFNYLNEFNSLENNAMHNTKDVTETTKQETITQVNTADNQSITEKQTETLNVVNVTSPEFINLSTELQYKNTVAPETVRAEALTENNEKVTTSVVTKTPKTILFNENYNETKEGADKINTLPIFKVTQTTKTAETTITPRKSIVTDAIQKTPYTSLEMKASASGVTSNDTITNTPDIYSKYDTTKSESYDTINTDRNATGASISYESTSNSLETLTKADKKVIIDVPITEMDASTSFLPTEKDSPRKKGIAKENLSSPKLFAQVTVNKGTTNKNFVIEFPEKSEAVNIKETGVVNEDLNTFEEKHVVVNNEMSENTNYNKGIHVLIDIDIS